MAGPGIRVAHRRSGQLDRADRSGTVRPHLLYVGTQYVVAWLTVGGLSGATALTLASGAKTAATAAAGRISLDQIASVAGAVFAVFRSAASSPEFARTCGRG